MFCQVNLDILTLTVEIFTMIGISDFFCNVHLYFRYASPTSQKSEVKTADGVVRGSYQYVDANNLVQTVNYVSDSMGFRVAATNLPKAPVSAETVPEQANIDLIDRISIKSLRNRKRDTFKNWPFIKNPQFLSYPHETW